MSVLCINYFRFRFVPFLGFPASPVGRKRLLGKAVPCTLFRVRMTIKKNSSWADGIARHAGATSAYPKKHHSCANPMQLSLNLKHKLVESTAGHMAGGSTNKYMPLSRTETQVTVDRHRHNLYCVAQYTT